MSYRFSHNSSFTKMIIVVEFLLVAYLLYSLTKNIYHSYVVDAHIARFEEENSLIEEENRQKTEDYLYFTSEEYIDKIAKQNLGLINPGEEVIVLSPDVLEPIDDFEDEDTDEYVHYSELSNPKQWLNFFFN